jgi:hypothetical protein
MHNEKPHNCQIRNIGVIREGCERHDMWHARDRRLRHKECYWKNVKVKNHSEDRGVEGR